jgi:hypothetical protein
VTEQTSFDFMDRLKALMLPRLLPHIHALDAPWAGCWVDFDLLVLRQDGRVLTLATAHEASHRPTRIWVSFGGDAGVEITSKFVPHHLIDNLIEQHYADHPSPRLVDMFFQVNNPNFWRESLFAQERQPDPRDRVQAFLNAVTRPPDLLDEIAWLDQPF